MIVCKKLLGFSLVEPVSVIACIKEKPHFLGVIGMAGGITPLFFGVFILHLAAWVKGFQLAE
jgi:hypothetical protein